VSLLNLMHGQYCRLCACGLNCHEDMNMSTMILRNTGWASFCFIISSAVRCWRSIVSISNQHFVAILLACYVWYRLMLSKMCHHLHRVLALRMRFACNAVNSCCSVWHDRLRIARSADTAQVVLSMHIYEFLLTLNV